MLSRHSSLSILQQVHTFPGPYVFKIIGDNGPELVAWSMQITIWVLGRWTRPTVTVRRSAGGRHQAVTLRVRMPDAEAVLDVYRGLRSLSGVRFLI